MIGYSHEKELLRGPWVEGLLGLKDSGFKDYSGVQRLRSWKGLGTRGEGKKEIQIIGVGD